MFVYTICTDPLSTTGIRHIISDLKGIESVISVDSITNTLNVHPGGRKVIFYDDVTILNDFDLKRYTSIKGYKVVLVSDHISSETINCIPSAKSELIRVKL